MCLALEYLLDLSSFASQTFSHNDIQMTGWLHLTSLHTHTLINHLSLESWWWAQPTKIWAYLDKKTRKSRQTSISWSTIITKTDHNRSFLSIKGLPVDFLEGSGYNQLFISSMQSGGCSCPNSLLLNQLEKTNLH